MDDRAVEKGDSTRVPFLRRVHAYEWIVLANLLAAHLLFAVTSAPVSPKWILNSIAFLAPLYFVLLLVGVAIRLLFALFTRTAKLYLRRVATVKWSVESIRIAISFALLVHSYGWMKLTLPLTNPRLFDKELWAFDQALFLGLSPNVLFLNLFPPAVLSFIDLSYEAAFTALVNLGVAIGFSHASNRYRAAFCTASALLWAGGGWLYFALPSLGPAYAFPDVWGESWRHFSSSRRAQYVLWKNYELVVRMKSGLGANVNFFFGVAAFPSLHVGWEGMLALWAHITARPIAVLLYVVTLFTLLGSVVTGWHYLVDGIAGFLLALLAFAAGVRMYRLSRWARLSRLVRRSSFSI